MKTGSVTISIVTGGEGLLEEVLTKQQGRKSGDMLASGNHYGPVIFYNPWFSRYTFRTSWAFLQVPHT